MKQYIGTKIVKAEPMDSDVASKILERELCLDNAQSHSMTANGEPIALGYLVEYPDGYKSWSPKKQFEEAYREMSMETQTPETLMRHEITASEALFAFCGWLTGREKPLTIGYKHDAAPVAELVKEFIDSQNLKDPREDYTQYLKDYPKS